MDQKDTIPELLLELGYSRVFQIVHVRSRDYLS